MRRHGFRKVPALTELHPALEKPANLLGGFHPFRDRFQTQALRHLNDVFGNQVAGAVGRERVDKDLSILRMSTFRE